MGGRVSFDSMPQHDQDGVRAATALFAETWPNLTPTIAVAAPGRINLIGEHTDYQEGFVFPLALTKNTYIVGAPLPLPEGEGDTNGEFKVRSRTLKFTTDTVSFKLNDALVASGGDKWVNGAMGMVKLYAKEGHKVLPFAAALWSDVPLGAGVSSSAAYEVSVGRFIEAVSNIRMGAVERAYLAQRCEHEYMGVKCGIMDQMISSAGKKDHALFIECSVPPKLKHVPLKAGNSRIVVANSMETHSLTEDDWYGKRVASCTAACKELGVKSLRHATTEMLEGVKEKLEARVYTEAGHVISENERTEQATQAFRRGDLEAFGRLMDASHDSLRDHYKVSSKGLDTLVDIAREVDGVYGTRMTGAGFGGCTVTLVKEDSVNELIEKLENEYPKRMKAQGIEIEKPDCFGTTAGAGARQLALEDKK